MSEKQKELQDRSLGCEDDRSTNTSNNNKKVDVLFFTKLLDD